MMGGSSHLPDLPRLLWGREPPTLGAAAACLVRVRVGVRGRVRVGCGLHG